MQKGSWRHQRGPDLDGVSLTSHKGRVTEVINSWKNASTHMSIEEKKQYLSYLVKGVENEFQALIRSNNKQFFDLLQSFFSTDENTRNESLEKCGEQALLNAKNAQSIVQRLGCQFAAFFFIAAAADSFNIIYRRGVNNKLKETMLLLSTTARIIENSPKKYPGLFNPRNFRKFISISLILLKVENETIDEFIEDYSEHDAEAAMNYWRNNGDKADELEKMYDRSVTLFERGYGKMFGANKRSMSVKLLKATIRKTAFPES